MRGVGEAQFVLSLEMGGLRLHPRDVGFGSGGIDDEQENIGRKLVGVKIVNHAAMLVAHERVLAVAGREPADVVGQNVIEEHGRAPPLTVTSPM